MTAQTNPAPVLYQVQIMVRGRFGGRYSPVLLKVEANSENAAKTAARAQAKKKIGTPGNVIGVCLDSDVRAIADAYNAQVVRS